MRLFLKGLLEGICGNVVRSLIDKIWITI